ncbi:hypothetical protein MGYG_07405 [Nannizzia gypsea CBS 118893]|uniref:Uncharacterized protein n=1 Tax=Arthroderma gypseum (strain ATCC MYA-4604 / CBS 118893) TaxID=535722 RepID=E4V325_ARTGP|nr:hypothetical protein MGYG_07405 [Nannizzia gypsea CBS 118893]EFR04399.1 hypothetical protein MGYG_07405 [Nannizzia gypsea CBS 118893]
MEPRLRCIQVLHLADHSPLTTRSEMAAQGIRTSPYRDGMCHGATGVAIGRVIKAIMYPTPTPELFLNLNRREEKRNIYCPFIMKPSRTPTPAPKTAVQSDEQVAYLTIKHR